MSKKKKQGANWEKRAAIPKINKGLISRNKRTFRPLRKRQPTQEETNNPWANR